MMCNIWPEALAIQKGLDSICIGIDNKKLCEIAGEEVGDIYNEGKSYDE